MSKRAGWYPDPFDASEHAGVRYWNGHHWTSDAMNRYQLAATQDRYAEQGIDAAVQLESGVPSGWWRRAVAYLLDGAILYAVILTAFWGDILLLSERWQAFTLAAQTQSPQLDEALEALAVTITEVYLPIMLAALGLQIGFSVMMVALFGASPGKLVMGIRIVTVEGRDVGFGTALWRWVTPLLVGFIPFVGGIIVIVDYLRPLWNSDNRALHDSWAGTIVVRRPRKVRVPVRGGAHRLASA